LIDSLQHTLTVSLPPGPVWMDGDVVRLSQVFSNLLNNAAKYTRTRGRIWLDATLERAEIVVRVRDTGIGIAPEMLPRIFDMFLQADNSLSRETSGLGIGLTLVRRLVEKHGGTVQAESGEGGSTFTVRLPILSDPQQESAPQDSKPAPSKAPALRVLIVDDNEDSAQTLGWMLELMGHEAIIAHKGVDAIALAPKILPHLILLDIGLPGMSGFDVCRTLRPLPGLEKTMFVAQTGWGQDEHRRMSREAGFHHHLVKPIDMKMLQGVLAEVAGK
jgi:CheY-like chemotaxis protein